MAFGNEFNLIGRYEIRKGRPYRITVRYPGNIVSAIEKLAGQIRTRAGGLLIADWDFDDPVYSSTVDKTVIGIKLSHTASSAIPVGIVSGFYDVEMSIVGYDGPIELIHGRVALRDEATLT